MKPYEIEAWGLRVIEAVEKHQPSEDSRVELKAKWPERHQRTARRIAGHANTARGVPILWLIGVDELKGVMGADQNELSTWWNQVKTHFEGIPPAPQDVVIYRNGKTVVALYFETDRMPYLVKNEAGPAQLEVPWREATAVRSATHSDLILLLSPLQNPALKVEAGKGRGFLNHYSSRLANAQAAQTYYARVRVQNAGRRTAERCRGYLANVEQWTGGLFRDTVYADFMPLTWSHNPGRESMELLPHVPHWLDVLSTWEGSNRFILETNPKAPTYSDCVWGVGVYRFTVRVFAEDADPSQAFVFLNWGGKWDDLDVFDETDWERRRPTFG